MSSENLCNAQNEKEKVVISRTCPAQNGRSPPHSVAIVTPTTITRQRPTCARASANTWEYIHGIIFTNESKLQLIKKTLVDPKNYFTPRDVV